MPMYGLSLGFVPPLATHAQMYLELGAVTMTFQNLLYTNTIMTNLPPLGSLPGPSVGPGQNVGNTSTDSIYPNMPRSSH